MNSCARSQWQLSEALALIREIQPKLHALKWHVALGGSVLNTGMSDKDIDLYFMPFDNVTAMRDSALFLTLVEWWHPPDPIGHEDMYPPNSTFAIKVKFQVSGRCVDAFIAKHAGTV